MIRSKRGLAVLGACGLIIGLVALSTSAVHAEKGANWMVNGKAVTKELSPEVFIAKIASADMTLLSKIAGQKFELLCKGAEFIGAKLEPEGVVGGGNKTKFGGCQVKLNGTISAACTPHTKGEPEGTIISTALKGELMLNAGEAIILFQPVVGETFLTLEFSEECSIGSSCAIIGKNSVKDVNGQFGTELVTHTVEQGSISELWIGSKTVEHQASVDGSAVLELSGAHKGLKWSGIPG
jgi:hypothetical protein